jgi:hypothetical protein
MPEPKKIDIKFKWVFISNVFFLGIFILVALYLSDKAVLNQHQEALFSTFTHLIATTSGMFIGLLGGKGL